MTIREAYRGITWDHPRGRHALEAAARGAEELDLVWEAHPLEGFESHPILDLTSRYDLIVLDHPHVGEAIEAAALRPLDDLIDAESLARWSEETVGSSFASYAVAGRQWALPLDAATQVAALDPARVAEAPATWADVERLSRQLPVALSLAGPHAFLTFASLCAALGAPLAGRGELDGPGPDAAEVGLVDTDTALAALETMTSIGAHQPAGSDALNPIGLLEAMSSGAGVAYCPLVYGYVNYSGGSLRYADAPVAVPGGRMGSTLGGTGLAISASATVSDALIEHLRALMSRETQCDFIPAHDGQPSARAAWHDPAVDAAAHGFYAATLATTEAAWVRPRYAGYIPFQTEASAHVRDVIAGRCTAGEGVRRLRAAYAASGSSPVSTNNLTPVPGG